MDKHVVGEDEMDVDILPGEPISAIQHRHSPREDGISENSDALYRRRGRLPISELLTPGDEPVIEEPRQVVQAPEVRLGSFEPTAPTASKFGSHPPSFFGSHFASPPAPFGFNNIIGASNSYQIVPGIANAMGGTIPNFGPAHSPVQHSSVPFPRSASDPSGAILSPRMVDVSSFYSGPTTTATAGGHFCYIQPPLSSGSGNALSRSLPSHPKHHTLMRGPAGLLKGQSKSSQQKWEKRQTSPSPVRPLSLDDLNLRAFVGPSLPVQSRPGDMTEVEDQKSPSSPWSRTDDSRGGSFPMADTPTSSNAFQKFRWQSRAGSFEARRDGGVTVAGQLPRIGSPARDDDGTADGVLARLKTASKKN